ncbi:hypothetical protein ABFS83_03G060600 [Erythranthe nasuta]
MKNPLLLSLTSHVLLLTIIITFTTTTTCLAIIIPQQFREAPKFYNSPNCPSISDHHATTTTSSNNNFNNDDDDNNTTKSGKFVCSAAAVHVAMTLDSAYLRGSMAAILSILQHTSCPQNVFFHFVASAAVDGGGESALGGALAASFPYLNFRIYSFRDSAVAGLISTSIRSALDCPLNYARSYLADLLPPCVRRVVYLDSDLVLVDDIARLAATPLGGGAVLAAPEYCNANFTSYFTAAFWSNPSLSLTFANRRACYFNTGVMVIDLERWRRGGYTARIEDWMELQKKMRIYELGSLPPFLLVFAGNIAPVDHKWNQHGLGGDNFRGLCRNLHPGPVSLLHWSGKGKPWARLDASRPCPLDALWAPYDLLKPPFSFDS